MSRNDISLRDIYGAISDLRKEMNIRVDKIESDVDSLKDFRARAMATFSIVSVFASAIFTWAWERIIGRK